MTIIVSTQASNDWTQTREQLCTRALQKMREIGEGEPPTPDQLALCLDALDSILKNLPWHGYAWPKRSPAFTALSCLATVQTKTLPSDFYGQEFINYVNASGQEIPLAPQTPEEWKSIILKSSQADRPDRYYIDNFNTLYLYPVPSVNVTLNLYYQAVVNDTVINSATDLDSPWMLGLVYGICAEVGDEFNVDLGRIQRFEAKWAMQRGLGIQNESFPGPDRMQVSD